MLGLCYAETAINPLPRSQMTEILDFSETVGCGVTFRLDSVEPCVLSVAQTGVRVKKSRFGFLGSILYDERNVYGPTRTGKHELHFPGAKTTHPYGRPRRSQLWRSVTR